MLSQGPNNPNSVVNDYSYPNGVYAWSNSTSVLIEDGIDAQAAMAGPTYSYYLKVTNFGFNLPMQAIIRGIGAIIKRREDDWPDNIYDASVRIVKNGIIGTTEKAVGGEWAASYVYQSYGGISDQWNETWKASDINATTFGLVLAVYAGFNPALARVDNIQITVYYDLPGDLGLTF